MGGIVSPVRESQPQRIPTGKANIFIYKRLCQCLYKSLEKPRGALLDLENAIRLGLQDRYRIERSIGSGGMGEVFLAHDIKHGRKVAIKVMRGDIISPATITRFEREFTTVARLTHPGILPVHDSGSVDGLLYYVSPYVEEGSLKDLLEREIQLPLDRALAILEDVGRAVSYAHSHGIVHRDLKPANILLEDGTPIIADFGLAISLRDESVDRTEAGGFAGTPTYMAPEQGPGSTNADERVDVYSLGCILYEMLSGEPPVKGGNAQAIMSRKMLGQIPSLRAIRPGVPVHIERAILKALDPVPADRFRSIEPFIRALRTEPSKLTRGSITAGVAALIVAAGAVSYLRSSAADIDSSMVVVDEFENRTGDSKLAAIGASIADWTAQGLHSTRLKSVVPTPAALQASRFARHSAQSEKSVNPLLLVAQETGAGLIVSGAYYLDHDNLTFHAELSQVSTRFWERLFRRPPHVELRTTLTPVVVPRDSVEKAIAEIRERIMAALSLVSGGSDFSAPELASKPPTFDSYDRFSAAMAAYISNDNSRAATGFLDAYRADTTFAVALLYAALSLSNIHQFAKEDSLLAIVARSPGRLTTYDRLWLDFRQSLLAGERSKALRAVRALADEAPRSKAAYNLAIEAWEDGHLEEALRALQSLPPEKGPVRNYLPYWGALANVQHQLGRYDDALKSSRAAREAHPERWWPLGWELSAMAALGQTDRVIARAQTIAQEPPDDMKWLPAESLREAAEELRAHGYPQAARTVWESALRGYLSSARSSPLGLRDQFGIASTQSALGRLDEAATTYSSILQLSPDDPIAIGQLAVIGAKKGDHFAARKTIESLLQRTEKYQFGESTFQAARIAAVLRDDQLALQLIRRAMSEGFAFGNWTHTEIDFERLRGNSEFKALVRPVPLNRDN